MSNQSKRATVEYFTDNVGAVTSQSYTREEQTSPNVPQMTEANHAEFVQFMRKALQVPKSEIDAKIAEAKSKKD